MQNCNFYSGEVIYYRYATPAPTEAWETEAWESDVSNTSSTAEMEEGPVHEGPVHKVPDVEDHLYFNLGVKSINLPSRYAGSDSDSYCLPYNSKVFTQTFAHGGSEVVAKIGSYGAAILGSFALLTIAVLGCSPLGHKKFGRGLAITLWIIGFFQILTLFLGVSDMCRSSYWYGWLSEEWSGEDGFVQCTYSSGAWLSTASVFLYIIAGGLAWSQWSNADGNHVFGMEWTHSENPPSSGSSAVHSHADTHDDEEEGEHLMIHEEKVPMAMKRKESA